MSNVNAILAYRNSPIYLLVLCVTGLHDSVVLRNIYNTRRKYIQVI